MFIALRINRKGFLLFLSYGSHRTGIRPIRPIRSIRVRIETSRGQAVYLCLSPSILSKGFIMFLSYSTTAIRPIRQIRGKTKKKHPEDRLLAGLK